MMNDSDYVQSVRLSNPAIFDSPPHGRKIHLTLESFEIQLRRAFVAGQKSVGSDATQKPLEFIDRLVEKMREKNRACRDSASSKA